VTNNTEILQNYKNVHKFRKNILLENVLDRKMSASLQKPGKIGCKGAIRKLDNCVTIVSGGGAKRCL